MQRHPERCRHRQEEAGACRKERQHGDPQRKRDTPLAWSSVTRGAATGEGLLLARGGSLHPAERAGRTYCAGEILTRRVGRKP